MSNKIECQLTYEMSRKKTKALLEKKKMQYQSLLVWLNRNNVNHPDWDKKIREYSNLENEITVIETRLQKLPRIRNPF